MFRHCIQRPSGFRRLFRAFCRVDACTSHELQDGTLSEFRCVRCRDAPLQSVLFQLGKSKLTTSTASLPTSNSMGPM
jgi:hypothetical protein